MLSDLQIVNYLMPHKVEIRKMYDDAMSFVNKISDLYGDEGVSMYMRSKASDLNNYLLEKAKVYFKNIENISVNDRYLSLLLNFDNNMLSRFKKLSPETLKSSHADNNRNTQLIQGTLFPEYPPFVFVEIGYFLNKAGTDYEKILVVKRIGKVAIALFEIEPLVKDSFVAMPAKEFTVHQEEDKKEETQIKRKKSS